MKRYLVITMFVLALILRVGFTLYNFYSHSTDYHAGDGLDYDATALNLVNRIGWVSPDLGGSLYSAQPLYPLFLAGVYSIFGHNFLIVGLIQALLGAFTCLICYNIARRLFLDIPAMISLVIMAVYPYFVFHTDRIGTETISAFLVSLMAYMLVEFYYRRRVSTIILVGLSLGLAALNRPELYIFPLFLFLWLIFSIKERKTAILYFLLASLIFILLVAPWHVYQSYKQNKIFIYPPITSARMLFAHTDLRLTEFFEHKKTYVQQRHEIDRDFIERSKGLSQKDEYNLVVSNVLQQFREQPLAYLRFIILKWKTFWSVFPYGHRYAKGIFRVSIGFINIVIMSLSVVGMTISFKDFQKTSLLISLIATFLLPHLAVISDPRYRLSIMPYIIIFAGFAIYKIVENTGYIKRRRESQI